jgi:hypothetical protein
MVTLSSESDILEKNPSGILLRKLHMVRRATDFKPREQRLKRI